MCALKLCLIRRSIPVVCTQAHSGETTWMGLPWPLMECYVCIKALPGLLERSCCVHAGTQRRDHVNGPALTYG